MMATIWPGATASTAGAVTCASTFPTATAMPAGSLVHAAAWAVSDPARPPSGQTERASLSAAKPAKSGCSAARKSRAGVPAVLVDALVAGRARVARLDPGELPDDPVGRLDPPVGGLVDLRVLRQQLQRLRELPLGRDPAAVPGQPRLAALGGDRVDPVRLRLAGVMLPELRIGVRPGPELRQLAQRGAVRAGGQHGAGSEVGPDADDPARVDARVGHRGRHRVPQDVGVVVRVLQRPVGRQRLAGPRQRLVHHAVPVLVHGGAEFGAVRDPHHDGAPGQRAEIDPDDAAVQDAGRCERSHPYCGVLYPLRRYLLRSRLTTAPIQQTAARLASGRGRGARSGAGAGRRDPRRRARPDDQVGRDRQDLGGLRAGDPVQQQVHGASAQLTEVLPHRRERRQEERGLRHVVEADDADVARHRPAALGERAQHARAPSDRSRTARR